MRLPILDLITADELHHDLVRSALRKRHPALDLDEYFAINDVESQVTYRSIPQADGTVQMLAAVSITRITPKPPIAPNDQGGKHDG